MRIRPQFLFLLSALVILACQNEKTQPLKPLNLLQYGIPLTIMAPDSATIKKENWISQSGVTIKAKDFDVQVWASEASVTDLPTLKASTLAEVEDERFFSRVVKEDPNGFLYENKIDSTTLYYGFRHIRVQGDRKYVIQNGLAGNFSLEQAEYMYDAIKKEEKK